jgi:hypothetical protein
MRIAAFLAFTTAWLLTPPARAQDEVGSKEKRKINIHYAKAATKNYEILYEDVIPKATVDRVGQALENVLEQYVLVFRFKPEEKLKVKFLDSQNTYEQEGGIPSAPAFFSPGTEFLVLKQRDFNELIPTAYHEACHQYLHFYVGRGVDIPTWFNEGMAYYYEEIQENKGTKKLDYKLIDNRKLRMIKDKITTRTAIPLEKLFFASYDEFHSKDDRHKEGLYYTQSFSVIYFLMQGMGGKPAFQFAEELRKTKDPNAAYEKLLGKDRKNLKSLEAKWKQYVLQAKIVEKPPVP